MEKIKLLFVSATPFEVQPLKDYLAGHFAEVSSSHFVKENLEVQLLVTGVGAVQTAFGLGHVLAVNKYQLVINAGIAGAFNRDLQLGDVVQVISEQFGDLGVEEKNGRFTDVFEMGLISKNQPPFNQGILTNPGSDKFDFLPTCKGLTVNKVHGTEASIKAIQSKYDADVESMEGAAFFYACAAVEVPFLQIRSISNYVEPRNRENWNLPLSITNLNKVLIDMIKVFQPSLV